MSLYIVSTLHEVSEEVVGNNDLCAKLLKSQNEFSVSGTLFSAAAGSVSLRSPWVVTACPASPVGLVLVLRGMSYVTFKGTVLTLAFVLRPAHAGKRLSPLVPAPTATRSPSWMQLGALSLGAGWSERPGSRQGPQGGSRDAVSRSTGLGCATVAVPRRPHLMPEICLPEMASEVAFPE